MTDEEIATLGEAARHREAPRRPEVDPARTPPGFRIVRAADGSTVITTRMGSPRDVAATLVPALVWIVFGVSLWLIAQADPDDGLENLVAVPVILGAVAAAVTWRSLAHVLDTAELAVGRHEVALRHRPLPLPGSARVPRDDVASVEARHLVHAAQRGGETHIHRVVARTRDGKVRRLFPDLDRAAEAQWVRDRIVDALRVADRPRTHGARPPA